jgi:translation initiation factor eIF-2B subunit epsilon
MDQSQKNEEKLNIKAVIIADTFTKMLDPLVDNFSEILLPVGNIPLLEYMIDFLFSNSIKEIIICAKKNNRSIETYLRKNYKKSKQFIKLLSSEDFIDVGDCLRKISAEKLISTSEDFVLIRGLVITNFNLEKAISFHKKVKENDYNRIMTSILKNYKNDKDIRTKYDESVVIYDKVTNRILQYEPLYECRKVEVNDNVQFKVTIDTKTKQNDQTLVNYYKVRSDLYDSFIDICNGEILNRFDENFDHQSMRDDFIKHSIVSDIYTDTFYLYELTTEDYVGVIKNIDSYMKISNEVINRWAHPVVLEHISAAPNLEINYKAMHMNIYLDSDVLVDSISRIISSVALAKGCEVEGGVELTSSSVGINTYLGQKSKIKNTIIFSECRIGEQVQLENCIIGNNCVIEGDLILKDCIIGDGVIVSENESEMRISKVKTEDEEEEEGDESCPKFEKIDKDTFEVNLEDKDLLFIKKEEVEEDEFDDDDSEEEESLHEDQDEENYEEMIEQGIITGLEKKTDIENILKEIFSLKDAIFEKTKAESIFF